MSKNNEQSSDSPLAFLPCFTIDQIKAAFWKTFHEEGELFFDYLGDPESNGRSTESFWSEFMDNLPSHEGREVI